MTMKMYTDDEKEHINNYDKEQVKEEEGDNEEEEEWNID